jgi:enoyl-CoA hydratase/carnithine racemase
LRTENAVSEEIRVQHSGRVLRVTLNRPRKHNALSRPLLTSLRAVFDGARDDADLACAVLTGAGERFFAAGGDVRDLAEVREEAAARAMAEEARAALDAVRTFPLPVVALLAGDAIGGGAELAVACDFRLMREGAHIGYVHGRLAITAAWGGGTDLLGLVGRARGLRMMVRGELVPADVALHWGLADAVAPAAGLEACLADFIEPLLALPAPALRGCKALAIAARQGAAYAERRAIEQDAFVASWISPAHWAALDRVLPGASGGR